MSIIRPYRDWRDKQPFSYLEHEVLTMEADIRAKDVAQPWLENKNWAIDPHICRMCIQWVCAACRVGSLSIRVHQAAASCYRDGCTAVIQDGFAVPVIHPPRSIAYYNHNEYMYEALQGMGGAWDESWLTMPLEHPPD